MAVLLLKVYPSLLIPSSGVSVMSLQISRWMYYYLKCTLLCVSPVQACVTFPAELAAKDAMCPVVYKLWAYAIA